MRTRVVFAMVATLLFSRVAVSADPSATGRVPRNETLRRELLQMASEDRAEPDLILQMRGVNVRQRNATRLEQIISEKGWPGWSLVGRDGARAAWLIAQHADFDVPLQKRCLGLMREALQFTDVDAEELAYLTDRILRNEHQPQMYGTQGVGVTSPEDEARVDANRKALGLEPWRVFTEELKKRVPGSGSGPRPVQEDGAERR